jgi:uncharacterized protein YbjT (DUF2867 family)
MITVLGATGKTGRYLVARLCEEGHAVTAAGRAPDRLDRVDARARRAVTDLDHPETLRTALNGASRIVSCAHARFTATVLAHLPATCERLVLTGSTRRFTAIADPAADAVRAGEAAFLASGVPGVMLHPSMIYGAPDDRNVNRLLRLLRYVPVVPLPDGGRHWVQPVFVDDVVDALVAAVTGPDAPGPPIIVAGPEPISYADMVRACARALGRSVAIVPVPLSLLVGGVRLAAGLGMHLPFDAAEIRRATEDKSFDVSQMRTRLGVTPRPFDEGLRLKLERGWV